MENGNDAFDSGKNQVVRIMKFKFETIPLFYQLDELLIDLLESLSPEDWKMPTVAKHWNVKDVAAHLLDGNIRGLSHSRDRYFGVKPPTLNSYHDLVDFINQQNESWTAVTQRISPRLLIELLKITGKQYADHLASLNPEDEAIFSVAWAGQNASPNWFHIAREYTEKFLHQQQIRDAVGKSGIMTREYFYPFIDILMRAFPYTFRDMDAKKGTKVGIEIISEIGGLWVIERKEENWDLISNPKSPLDAKVQLNPHVAWKLFSKSWRPSQVIDQVIFEGDPKLGRQALNLLGFMA